MLDTQDVKILYPIISSFIVLVFIYWYIGEWFREFIFHKETRRPKINRIIKTLKELLIILCIVVIALTVLIALRLVLT